MVLRLRTGYSFRRAAGNLEGAVERLSEIGSEFAPITDTASTFGWIPWDQLTRKAGLKPVFGIELAVSHELGHERSKAGMQPDYWLFFSKGSVEPINRLLNKATEQFRYQPLLSVEQALAAGTELNVVMGHKSKLTDEQWSAPAKGVSLGVSPALSNGVLKRALKNKWPLAATSDNRYLRPDDRDFYITLAGRIVDAQVYPQHLLSDSEWIDAISHLDLTKAKKKGAIDRALSILSESTAVLTKASLPDVPKTRTLEQMCRENAPSLGIDLDDSVYASRLKRELDLIAEKKYEDYFYIVADLCQWARNVMMVGPARGSSCGSLVCYLLRITTVDPIPHGLIFERFIDINRSDLPDIDIDFSDQQRHLVFEYMQHKYGSDRVAKLGVVTTYLPKSALNEVSAALKIPKGFITPVVDSLIERSSGDARALNTLEDSLQSSLAGQKLLNRYPNIVLATKFEGHPRHYSTHAAGVVVASEPIAKYVAVDARSGSTQCDKIDAEHINLLKIDALGLTQLSVLEDTLKAVGLPNNFLEKLPLEDSEAFSVLNKGHWAGIFQFNGMALQSLAKQYKITEFNDIVATTALARPGPLASGIANEWVKRKNRTQPVTYLHPEFERYTHDTLGTVLYQEQILEIGRWGGLGWGEVTALRKAMSKSLGKEYFDKFGDPWKKGAISLGLDPAVADKAWNDMCSFGSWAFNKSHAVAYGLISYWCCYLKAHHPHEFAAATLSHEDTPEKQIAILRELATEGITYVPVDPELSGEKWTVRSNSDGTRTLVGPLSAVIGIGPKTIKSIVSARALGRPIPDRAHKILRNARTKIRSLYPIGDAFNRILPDPSVRNIHTSPVKIGSLGLTNDWQDVLVFGTLAKINPRDENEAVNVAKRGGKIITGEETRSLNLQIKDDSGQVFGKITRKDFVNLAPEIIERGKLNTALYAFKGSIPPKRNEEDSFIMLLVKKVRYIGDINDALGDESPVTVETSEEQENQEDAANV